MLQYHTVLVIVRLKQGAKSFFHKGDYIKALQIHNSKFSRLLLFLTNNLFIPYTNSQNCIFRKIHAPVLRNWFWAANTPHKFFIRPLLFQTWNVLYLKRHQNHLCIIFSHLQAVYLSFKTILSSFRSKNVCIPFEHPSFHKKEFHSLYSEAAFPVRCCSA